MTPDPKLLAYLEQLAATHRFTLEQLAANREGRIHPEQLARHRRSGMRWIVTLVVFAVLVGAAGVIGAVEIYGFPPPSDRVDRNGFFALAGGGLLLAVGFVVGAVVVALKIRRMTGQSAGVVAGPVQKIDVSGPGGNTYSYVVSNRRFEFIPHDGWVLVTQGMRYRAYFMGNRLLSIEPA